MEERRARGEDRLLRISEIQEYCSISRAKAYRLLDEGLTHVRLGATVRVRRRDLEQFLAEREVTGQRG